MVAVVSFERPCKIKTSAAQGSSSSAKVWRLLPLSAVLFLLVSLEWSLFHRCFVRHIAASYPVGWDQIAVINRIYQLHFDWAKFGPRIFYAENAWLFDKASMKGFVSQLLGLVLTQIFGVSRLVSVSVNFVWFLFGQTAVFAYLYRRYQAPAAFCGVGLYLTSFAHYTPIGGIFDMRLDYAAMVVLGIATLSIWEYIERSARSRFFAATFCLLLSVFTRSISIFYMVAGLSALSAVLLSYRLTRPADIQIQVLCKRALRICISSFACLALFLGVYGKHFFKYYAQRTIDGEASMRTATYGLHGLSETVYFNLQNAFHLYVWLLITISIVLVSSLGLVIWAGKENKNLYQQKLKTRPFLLLVSTTCLAGCAFFFINLYTPSFHGMGVITIPLACALVAWLNSEVKVAGRKVWIPALVALASGLLCFSVQMTYPSAKMVAPLDQSDLISEVNRRLIGHTKLRDRTRVAYVLETEGLQPENLLLQWYETQLSAPPENLQPVSVPVFHAINWTRLKDFINEDDFVVVPSFTSSLDDQTFRNLGQTSVLTQLPLIRQELGAIYARKEVLMDCDGDFKVEIYGH